MTDNPADDDQPTDLRRLVYPSTIRHPSDVARLRAVLNDRGYDASDRDIQDAYRNWCDEWATGPLSLAARTDDEMFVVLWERLEYGDRSDGPPT